ncbi:MAG: FapA family protein [Clostridiales bacterium]|nr:FapA family protein [Clostridiales bacterium]
MVLTDGFAKNESLIIEISDDRMEAVIYFIPPEGDGLPLTEDDIQEAIYNKNIRFGLKTDVIKQLSFERAFGAAYIIAEGVKPVQGRSGKISYHFDPNGPKPTPKVNANGSVNYHDLGLLRSCKAGDVLVSIEGAEKGESGCDILGNVLFPKSVKLDLSFLQGDNTRVSEDGERLSADSDGVVRMEYGKVSVSQSVVINGDVNNATGDIVFSGAVYVRGSVRTGFTVKADAGIRIGGVVEAARLETRGDIVLEAGVRGAGTAVIIAGGNIRAKFLESCSVTAQGDITSDSALNSQIMCAGSLTLAGRYGVLVGGKAVVRKSITAKSIGSAVSTPTEVYVGCDPEIMRLYWELSDEYAYTVKQYKETSLAIHSLQEQASLRARRKMSLLRLLESKILLREKLESIKKRLDDIQPDMKSDEGVISAGFMIHFGVKAMIGNAIIYIRDDLANCVLTNVDGKINIGVKV